MMSAEPNLPTDEQLVERVRGGDDEAYAQLVRRYERLVRAAVQNLVRDLHAAEDAAQETFLAAFESLESLRQAARFGPWVLSIARNQAASAARKRVRAEVCVPDVPSIASGKPSTNGRLSDRSERLLELVERLPEHERIVVGLRYFDGHSVEAVARISGRPVGTVTKQLSRAHARLEQWLKQESHS
jgi:RNA polymerase sigma-70 factor (ECF subfamily)